MTYLLISILLVLLVLIIVLAAFIFVQQKQIAVIKDLATSNAPSASETPTKAATAEVAEATKATTTEAVVPVLDPPQFTYERKHSERKTEIIAVSTYQEKLSLAEPMTALIKTLASTDSVLLLDLTLDRQSAQLLGCRANLEELQPVSEHLAYLTLQHIRKIEDVLETYRQQFDQIYVLLPHLQHSRTAAVLPHTQTYTLLMEPDGETYALEQGFESLSKMVQPEQWFLGLTAVHYDQSNARHEQVVTALSSDYSDLFLGVITEQDASDAHEKWSSQFIQRRAEETLSLVA